MLIFGYYKYAAVNIHIQVFVWKHLFLLGIYLGGKSHGQRSLEGYRPQGRIESDTTERQSTEAEQGHVLLTVNRVAADVVRHVDL